MSESRWVFCDFCNWSAKVEHPISSCPECGKTGSDFEYSKRVLKFKDCDAYCYGQRDYFDTSKDNSDNCDG